MPWRLLKYGLRRSHPDARMFTRHDSLKPAYDVAIIGGGNTGRASGDGPRFTLWSGPSYSHYFWNPLFAIATELVGGADPASPIRSGGLVP